MRQPATDAGAPQLATHQPGQEHFCVIRSEDVEWKQFAAFPPQARLAVLVGDPTKAGPYLIRVKLPGGTKMMPHEHPEDRIYTPTTTPDVSQINHNVPRRLRATDEQVAL